MPGFSTAPISVAHAGSHHIARVLSPSTGDLNRSKGGPCRHLGLPGLLQRPGKKPPVEAFLPVSRIFERHSFELCPVIAGPAGRKGRERGRDGRKRGGHALAQQGQGGKQIALLRRESGAERIGPAVSGAAGLGKGFRNEGGGGGPPFAGARPAPMRMLPDFPSLPEPPIFGLSSAKLGYVRSNLACMGWSRASGAWTEREFIKTEGRTCITKFP